MTKKMTLYNQLLKLLDVNLKAIKTACSSKELIETYENLLAHLRSLKQEEVIEIFFSGQSKTGSKASKNILSEESGGDISLLGMEAVEKLIHDQNTSRHTLETIARTKFGMTSGGIKSIKKKSILVEKLQNLIDNEKTHESIIRLAEGSDPGTPRNR